MERPSPLESQSVAPSPRWGEGEGGILARRGASRRPMPDGDGALTHPFAPPLTPGEPERGPLSPTMGRGGRKNPYLRAKSRFFAGAQNDIAPAPEGPECGPLCPTSKSPRRVERSSWLVSWPAVLENLLRWALEVSGRPVVAEAARAIGSSLVGRSAPRPLLPRRGRISGPARAGSLHSQARREKAQGQGTETSAYQRRLP